MGLGWYIWVWDWGIEIDPTYELLQKSALLTVLQADLLYEVPDRPSMWYIFDKPNNETTVNIAKVRNCLHITILKSSF